jgi:glycosyltransferase involved in cell wall biosynthesis
MVFGHYYLAKEWIKSGHNVTLVAASFSHTRRIQPTVAPYRLWTKELHDGIEYVWIRTPKYANQSIIGRMFSIIVYTMISLLYSLRSAKADVVISSSHHPFSIFPAKILSYRSKCKLIFEVRDLWPLSLVLIGKLSGKNPGVFFMSLAEKYAYKCSSYVVSVLPSAKSYMLSKGLAPEKFCYIPNGVSFSPKEDYSSNTQSADDNVPEEIDIFRTNFDYIIGYFGRLGEAQELEKIIEVVSLLPDNVGILLVGNGPCKKDLINLASKLDIAERVLFTGLVSKAKADALITHVDICYLGLIETPVFEFGVSPTKLNDYLLAAKPVIYAIKSVDSEILDCPAIFPCNPNSSDSMLLTLNNLMSKDILSLGQKGYLWAKDNRDYKILADKFLIGPL